MRKYLIPIVAIVLAVGAASPAQAGSWRWRECRFQTWNGQPGWTTEEVKLTIRCLAPRFDISTTKALYVASHESGFHADTGSGTYCGVYQHGRDYFLGRLAAAKDRWPHLTWMGRRCENGRSNILAAFYLVKASGGWEAGWCRWTAYC